ncbi:DUF58 domain-containing protein [Pyrococcus sp. ST04]|uniref:DUF58 domain-containing protein n=1 Tax=Pyrococcus sp. ST04 TaxID=1183377 RepID=UPI0002605AA6|nr:DUF58 domain-containing protein [Pyrococcus sp. ST04]AFK22103.1 hypothetical protein Py04_0501 [Pyrococcus sp. ST04]
MKGAHFFISLFLWFILMALLFGTPAEIALIPLTVLIIAFLIPSPQVVDVRREIKKVRIRIGEEVEVRVKIKFNGIGPVFVRDLVPAPFKVAGSTSKFSFIHPLKREVEIFYRLKPLKRGKFTLKGVEVLSFHFLRVHPMRWSLEGEEVEVLVLPPLQVGRSARLRRILTKGFPVTLYSLTGSITTDFKEIREYSPGDPFKFINWKATARSGKLLVNEFEREGKRSVMIFLDARIEEVGSYVENPLEYAITLAYALAEFHLSIGNNVGLYVVGQEKIVTPSSSSSHRETILKALLGAVKTTDETFEEAFKKAKSVLTRFSPTVIIITNVDEEKARELKNIKYRKAMIVDVSIYGKFEENLRPLINVKKRAIHKEIGIPAILWDVSKEDARKALIRVVRSA